MRSDKLAIIPPKDSDPIYYELNLHNYHDYLHYLQNIANRKWKDKRLELVDISKGLIEVLQNTGFTIEMILEYGPSQIAEKLGIDDYIAQIIFKETIKAITSFKKSIQKVKE
jgi:hypothetical protein